MLDRITRNELESVDEEIRDVIEVINRAPYARTIASCAGYGIAGESRNRHRRDETEKAYLAVDCGFRPSRSAVPADADHPYRPRRSPGA